jgi:tetratricopeptide (TPR) repeat protein
MQPTPAIFHGRDRLVDNLVSTIVRGQTSKGSNIAIMGSGGMGKTSVALAVINHQRILQAFGNFRHWIPCDLRYTIPLLLDHFAGILSITATSGDLLGDIISNLQESNISRVILLDNFETLWDLTETKSESQAILSSLASIPCITILLTMRGTLRPSGVRWMLLPPIEPLSLDAARDTFMDISPYIDNGLDDLLRALDCVPLAINLVATVGQVGIMPSELLRKWETQRTPLLDVSPDRLNSVDISIRLSLNSPRMVSDPDALTLLAILASLPGGIRPENLEKVAPTIRNTTTAEITLLAAALAYRSSDGSLQILSPIRSYMLQYHPLDVAHRRALQIFYFQLSEGGRHDPGTQAFTAASQLLSMEESNIRSIIMNALDDQTSVHAIQSALNYSNYLYWHIATTDVLSKAIESIQSHASPELDLLLPHCLFRLGRLLFRLDEYHPAISVLKKAEARFRVLEDWRNVAECSLCIAYVYRLLGKYKLAVQSATTAQTYFATTGHLLNVSYALQELGRIYDEQDKHTEAMAAFAEAQAVCTDLGDRACLVQCHRCFGITFTSQGRYEEAIALLTEARNYYLEFGSRFHAETTLYNLGIVYCLQRNYDEADAALTEAHAGFKVLGNHASMAWCQYRLGELNRLRGHFEEAIGFFQRAVQRFEKIGKNHRVANCLAGQARVFAALGQVQGARQLFNDALRAMGNHECYDDFILTFKEDMRALGMLLPNYRFIS